MAGADPHRLLPVWLRLRRRSTGSIAESWTRGSRAWWGRRRTSSAKWHKTGPARRANP